MATSMKIVESIQWDSRDGAVSYREVYNEGSKGQPVDAGFDTNDPNFQKKVSDIAERRIGRRVDEFTWGSE